MEIIVSKDNEKNYLRNIGEEGQKHAYHKPFSDEKCGAYLMDIGSIISLLPPPPCKILDLGVGSGWTSVFFAQRGYQVIGQDISDDFLDLANKNKTRYQIKTLEFMACDYEELPFIDEFDCALFYDSLHHSTNAEKAINAVYRSLKSGGLFISIEPGIGHSKSAESNKAKEMYGVTEKDMPPVLITKLGKKAGFRKVKIYLRQNNHPIEIIPHLSIRGFINACKIFVRFLPVMGHLKSNITTMIK